MSAMNKIVSGLKDALTVAKCDHALVMTPNQPSDKRYVRQFCPRCEGTFLSPRSKPSVLHRVLGQ